MIVTTVTDEVSKTLGLEDTFKIAAGEGITHFEIRAVDGERFPLCGRDGLNKLKKAAKEYGITYTAASPGIFKVSMDSEEFGYHRSGLLDETMNFSEELGIKRIIIFGIRRSSEDKPGDYARVVDELGTAALKAAGRGFELLVENEPGWWTDTSDNCLEILKTINMNAFRLNWDPGNLYNTGEKDYKPGYEKLKKYIANVHLKDAVVKDGKNMWVPMGEGDIDYVSQIADLKNDRYDGYITIETHCRPLLVEHFVKSARYVKKLLQT